MIELQTEDYPDSEIKAEQERLNALYDTFSKQYGLINSRANISAFSQDSSFSCLLYTSGTTPHLKASKDEIRAFFEATADEDARISYIKRIFNNDYTEVILSGGRRVGCLLYTSG